MDLEKDCKNGYLYGPSNVPPEIDGKPVYCVVYDTDPDHTDYGDKRVGRYIIRNSPYVKDVKNSIKYERHEYTEEEKAALLKKYDDWKNDRIPEKNLSLDEIIIFSNLMKKEGQCLDDQ